MDERLFPSKKNVPAAYAGSIALHSSYDPIKEAERYVESLEIKKDVKHFILLEPALAYIIPVLRKKNPEAAIVALRCSSFFEGKGMPDAEWQEGSGKTLQAFLEYCIDDADIPYIKIIEWRPSMDAYKDTYASLLEEIRTFIKRGAANLTTVKAFGRRWIKNCLRNAGTLKKILTFIPGTCPVLVCGAGPGLETSIPLIKRFQQKEHLFIVAVSSSCMALQKNGITPHMVIGSDGGNWARFHFIEYERASPRNHFVCATLNAALPSQCGEHPVLVLGDGSAWQSILLEKLSIPHLRFPQRGTVTAAALDLAFRLTDGNVFVSGIDLSSDDLLTHARPYAFDILISSQTNRLHPYYSDMFKRKAEENPGTLDIYADWFRHYLQNYPGRIFSLGKNHKVFPSFFDEDYTSVSSFSNRLPVFSVTILEKQRLFPLHVLLHAIEDKESGTDVRNELLELLQLDDTCEDIHSALKQSLTSLRGTGT